MTALEYKWHYMHSLIPMGDCDCVLYTDMINNTVIEARWIEKKNKFYDANNKEIKLFYMWAFKNDL